MGGAFVMDADDLTRLFADLPDVELEFADDDALSKVLADQPDVDLDLLDNDALTQLLADLDAVDIDLSAFDAPTSPPPPPPHTLSWQQRLSMLHNIGNDPAGATGHAPE